MMKRKLAPLVPCPELRHVNKTMIIKIPKEFREPGHPIFRIVSSLDDIEKPTVKFKANDILKTILEKGTAEETSDAIHEELKKGNSLGLSEVLHKKPTKQVANTKAPNEGHETRTAYHELYGRDTDTNNTAISTTVDSYHEKINQFCYASKSSVKEPIVAPKELKTSRPVKWENLPVFNDFQIAGSECKTFQPLSNPSHLVPQQQQILQPKSTKMYGKFSSHNQEPFKDYKDLGSSLAVNADINCRPPGLSSFSNRDSDSSHETPESNITAPKEGVGFRIPQNRGFGPPKEINSSKDHISFWKKEYDEPMLPQQKKCALRKGVKRNWNSDQFQLSEDSDPGSSSVQKSVVPPDPLCQHSDFSSLGQCSSDNHKPLGSANQNDLKSFLLHHGSGLETGEQRICFGDSSGVGSENLFGNASSSFSMHRGSIWGRDDPSQSAPAYSSNKNYKAIHQEEQMQRMSVQTSRSRNKRQVASETIYKVASEFPKHCFRKDLEGEIKQILFLDATSYSNFFREFKKIPPPGMHFWVFMPSTYKLKYPNELVNIRLLNMKLLRIILGDVNVKFPDTIYDLHNSLPLSVQFIVISNREFSKVESIKDNRTVHLVRPKFNEDMMSEILRYIFKIVSSAAGAITWNR